jgi:hypothetical protein
LKIKNATRTEKTYSLPHESYCKTGPCTCTDKTLPMREHLPDGSSGVREVPRRICSSVTFLGGEVKEVDDRTRLVPEVKAALDRGDLREVKS